MFNNEVTYDKKWDTEENKAWQKKVENRFFDRSICSPSCPNAWAKEVYELLSKFDDELGIAWNTETIRSYYVQGKWYYLLTIGTVFAPIKSLYHSMVGYKAAKSSWDKEYYGKLSFLKKLHHASTTPISTFRYGLKAFRVQVVSHIMNKIKRPKFVLSQVKEKYGRLEIYYSAPSYMEEYIDHEIAKTKVKLSLKGAYYPIADLFDSYVSSNVATEYSPEDMYVKQTKWGKEWGRTTYRKAMKELGVDVAALATTSKFGKDEDDKSQETESV